MRWLAVSVISWLSGQQQVGVGAVVAAPDAATQLVELGQAETVGAVNDDSVDVGHIQARLDDGGADQHVGLAVGEGDHNVFEFGLGHLAVADGETGFGHQLLEFLGDVLDGTDAVVEEEDLSVALEFAQDGLADDVGAVLGYESFDGQTFFRAACG